MPRSRSRGRGGGGGGGGGGKGRGGNFSLIVRNIGHNEAEPLRKAFSEFGEVADVYIPKDYNTKQPKDFAFVEFAHEDESLEALDKMDGEEVGGSKLRVEAARHGRRDARAMRGKGGDRGGRSSRRRDSRARGRGGRRDSRERKRANSRGRDSRRR